MTTLIKLGGSFITDKRQPRSFRRRAAQNIAAQVKQIRTVQPDRRIVIGHGSGSFGHFEAAQYNTIQGVESEADWLGFAKVGYVAAELSQLALDELVTAGLPAIRFQPSALIRASNRKIKSMNAGLISRALDHRLIPVVHGDIAFDEQLGGTIVSTESIFAWLVGQLDVKSIILLGEVDGVLDSSNAVIREIRPGAANRIKDALGGSSGIDVTGGMIQKVEEMVALVKRHPDLEIVIANGSRPNVLVDIVCNHNKIGTRIRSG